MTYIAHYSSQNRVGIHYLLWHERCKGDFTNRIDKRVEKVELPPWYYGYTYLGGDTMWINKDLDYKPEEKRETEVHEAIHTDDEYETRVISRDMIKEESDEVIISRLMPFISEDYSYSTKTQRRLPLN